MSKTTPAVPETDGANSVQADTTAQEQPTILSLAVSDAEGGPSEQSVLAFLENVRYLSDGKIVIEPIWNAGAETAAGFERGVLAAVRSGQFDLGLAASRAWEEEGITAFQPLQTPFLIDNDALAIAVATSDLAAQMLDSLSASGIAGLTIWPEDLRHPFSVVPGKALLSPDDFAGLTIRTTSMGVTAALVEALGGSPEFEAFTYQGTESGLRQGYTLSGRPIATGNVVFFPKFQVLFANGAAFDELNDEQRILLREAAAATQERTIAERPSNVDLAAAWCSDGGAVVLADKAQLAALIKAAQPAVDQIEADPANKKIVSAIRDIKAKTEPGPAVVACESTLAQEAPVESEEAWSEGLPPDGTWAVELTVEDVVGMGVLQSNAEGWAGSSIYEFQGGEGSYHGRFLDGFVIDCPLTYEVIEDFFRLTYIDLGLENYECGEQVDDLQWRLDDDGLHLHVVAIHDGLPVENTALYEARPWQKGEEWLEGMPPDGTWQVELTADDFVEAGVMKSVSEDEWAGIYTFTLDKGEFRSDWQGKKYTGKCQATYEAVENIVRFTYYSDTGECEGQIDEVQWRLDEDGLYWNIIEIKNAPANEIAVIYEAKPWQKINN